MTDDTAIVVNPGDLEPELRTTLAGFLQAAELSDAEASEIRAALDAGVTYFGAGGATGTYTIRRA